MDIYDVAEAIDTPVAIWPGNCDGIVHLILQAGLVNAKARRGHWLGPIHPHSHFAGHPFAQHSWLEKPDGTIVDPTRWCFEAVEPYIYEGQNDYYDTGSNALRRTFRQLCPAHHPYDQPARLVMDEPVAAFIGELISVASDAPVPWITKSQALWLANLAPDELGSYAHEVYEALTKAGLRAFIPIDNYRMVMEE